METPPPPVGCATGRMYHYTINTTRSSADVAVIADRTTSLHAAVLLSAITHVPRPNAPFLFLLRSQRLNL